MSSKHLLVVAATAASLVLVAPALGSTIISFRTPTGNIGCAVQIGVRTSTPVVHTVELLDWASGGPAPAALERVAT